VSLFRRVSWLAAGVFYCGPLFAQTHVRYIISLVSPERHLVRVTVEIPLGDDTHELQLPVWNALYQVRDFSQYMNWIRAEDSSGHALAVTVLNSSRWRISGTKNGAHVEYEMFSDNPDPYGAQLNSRHAFFNLAEILVYADDGRDAPTEVEFRDLPPGWKIATPLPQNNGAYVAENYDQLVDSPVEIGAFVESDFSGSCGKCRVILDRKDGSARDLSDVKAILERIVPTIQRIVSAATSWMDDCPFQSYIFIYHVSDSPGGGGMEHAYSTAITLPTKNITDNPEQFSGTTAHEFFHLWNVKRIRPQSLEPIDYTKENYTTALWFSEGVDSTVGEYIRLRAGVLDEPHYLDHLSQEITELENRPAHLTQSVEDASMDAWLEKYAYYNLPERSISYYNKGELLGVLLDLIMRDASHDQSSLRELFRWMNMHYAKEGKFFADSEAVRQAAETFSHSDLRDFFRKYVSGVGEVPWDSFFARVGLHVVKTQVTLADAGFEAVQKFDQPPSVVQVTSGSEAERAGLKPEDVILQINGKPAGRDFEAQVMSLSPGARLSLVVRKGGTERRLEWKLASRERMVFQLQDVHDITPQQRARRAAWLFGAKDATP
jgi:predicted metalloprotease with PDZ domain